MEKKIILIKSASMDLNKKKDRDENTLIRTTKRIREQLTSDSSIEVWKNFKREEAEEFNLHESYTKDIKLAASLVLKGDINKNDLSRVFFMSSFNYNKFGDPNKQISEVTMSTTFANMLIGSDPELLLMKEGKVVHADLVDGFNDNSFGQDGAMAEIRPDPSTTPEGIVENMRKIFSRKDTAVEKLDWISTCYLESEKRDYPVGSHIHIGNPKKIEKNLNVDEKKRLFAVTNKILDELLTIPLIRLDGKYGYKRRARCKMSVHSGYGNNYGKGYGFFGEWRGTKGRLEFRSLSGLVIANPELCKAVFGTAMAIAEAVYKEALDNKLNGEIILPKKFNILNIYTDKFTEWGDIPLASMFGCTTDSGAMSKIINNSDRSEISIKYIENWLKKMSNLSTFKKYENYIICLADILSNHTNKLIKLNKNIKNNWREEI